MDGSQEVALLNIVATALWLAVLLILLKVWLTRRLEDSLAYLVYLRERKVLFVSLLGTLAALRVVTALLNVASGLGWSIRSSTVSTVGLGASLVGAVLVFLFAWLILWKGPSRVRPSVVLDVPEHFSYSLGVVDRAESQREGREPSS